MASAGAGQAFAVHPATRIGVGSKLTGNPCKTWPRARKLQAWLRRHPAGYVLLPLQTRDDPNNNNTNNTPPHALGKTACSCGKVFATKHQLAGHRGWGGCKVPRTSQRMSQRQGGRAGQESNPANPDALASTAVTGTAMQELICQVHADHNFWFDGTVEEDPPALTAGALAHIARSTKDYLHGVVRSAFFLQNYCGAGRNHGVYVTVMLISHDFSGFQLLLSVSAASARPCRKGARGVSS